MPSERNMEKAREEWRPVRGYEDKYDVSSTGRVRSISRMVIHGYDNNGNPRFRREKGRLRKLYRNRWGHMLTSVTRDGKTTSVQVHRLVLEAFVGPRPTGQECRHLNGDGADNRVENLRWGTASENCVDTVRHQRQHAMKLTPACVRSIRASNESNRKLAARYGVCSQTIWKIRARKTWRHI